MPEFIVLAHKTRVFLNKQKLVKSIKKVMCHCSNYKLREKLMRDSFHQTQHSRTHVTCHLLFTHWSLSLTLVCFRKVLISTSNFRQHFFFAFFWIPKTNSRDFLVRLMCSQFHSKKKWVKRPRNAEWKFPFRLEHLLLIIARASWELAHEAIFHLKKIDKKNSTKEREFLKKRSWKEKLMTFLTNLWEYFFI